MSLLDLKINKNLLDIKFEGYKLSLDSIPVIRHPVIDGVKYVKLGKDDYSYGHTRMNLLLNHLFQDPWSPNTVFYVNQKNCVLWTSLSQDSHLQASKCVWEMNSDEVTGYVTIYFPSTDWAVLCSGKVLHILYTPSRAAGEPWMCSHKQKLDQNSSFWLVLHAVHRMMPGGQQMNCLLMTIGPKSPLPTKTSTSSFQYILNLVTFSSNQDCQSWNMKRSRVLKGSSFPEYAALDCGGDAICVISQNGFHFSNDSGREVHNTKENKEFLELKYTYVQTHQDIEVDLCVPKDTTFQDIEVNFSPTQIEVIFENAYFVGYLENTINIAGCRWHFEDGKLKAHLLKEIQNLTWPQLFKKKDTEEKELTDEIQHTGDMKDAVNDGVPFNTGQLEECDSSDEPLIFQRIDGNDHKETHRINMSGHQWMFLKQMKPDQLPAICIRYDVDSIILQPTLDYNETEQFELEHIAVFSALGYVQASKQDKKFISCSPDLSYSAISDCSRHVYVYCQPEDLQHSELRNRKTGQLVAHIAKQYVVSLEDAECILGMQLSADCIFILTSNILYVAKVCGIYNI